MKNIKEKLINTLGVFGIIIFYLIRLIISFLPFLMINGNFFMIFALLLINYFIPFTSAIFWIWGLICAIKGVQDFWSILYYIVFTIVWIPFYFDTIVTLIKKD